MKGPRILALDLGTSGCKAALFDDGRHVSGAAVPLATNHPGPGLAEQDPDAWWDALISVTRSTLAAAGGAGPDALAVTGQSDSLVALDGDGLAVRPCLLWMDGRGAEALDRGVARVGEAELQRRTGLRPGRNFTAPKAAWLAANEPEAYARTRWLVQPKDALVARLTGTVVTDPSSASRTLLFDVGRGAWSEDLVAAFGLDADRLPPVQPSDAAAGTISATAAQALGVAAGTPVAVGGADRAVEALGIGLGGTETMVSTGTATGVVRAMAPGSAMDDPAVISPCHVIAGERLAILSQPTSGTVLDWLTELLLGDREAVEALAAEAAASEPGAKGVVVLPHLMGARSVRWNPDARGVIAGLNLGSTRGDLARAVIEGVSFEVRACLARLDAALGPTDRLLLAGGAHRAPLWASTLIDVTGVPGVRFADRDAALVGAMLLGSSSIGAGDGDLRARARRRLTEAQSYAVDADNHRRYARLADRYEALYRATSGPDLVV